MNMYFVQHSHGHKVAYLISDLEVDTNLIRPSFIDKTLAFSPTD